MLALVEQLAEAQRRFDGGDVEGARTTFRALLGDPAWDRLSAAEFGRLESLAFALEEVPALLERLEGRTYGQGADEFLFLSARLWARRSLSSSSDRRASHREVETRLSALLDAQPGFSRAHALLAWLFEKTGRKAEAIEAWKAAFVLDHGQPAYQLGLGLALCTARRYREAIPLFRRLVEDEASVEVLTNLGLAHREVGEFEEALAAFERIIPLDAASARPHVEVGLCLRGLGRPEEALASFARAIELEPGRVEALVQRSRLQLRLQRKEEAEADLARAEGIQPDDPGVLRLREQLSEAPRGEDEDTLAPHFMERPSFRADLAVFGLAEVVEFLSVTRKTGFIELTEGHLELIEGRLLSGDAEGQASFVERLLAEGIAPPAPLLGSAGGRLLKAAALETEFAVDDAVVQQVASENAVGAVLSFLVSEEGEASFVEASLDEEAVARAKRWSVDAQGVLLEAFRRLDEARRPRA